MLETVKATGNGYIYCRYLALESLHFVCVFLLNTPLVSTHFCAELKVFKRSNY